MEKKLISRKCPICKSEDLDYLPWLGQIYRCRKCGYTGPLVIEEIGGSKQTNFKKKR